MIKKKIWANFQRIVAVFTQRCFNMLSNIWVWDPGSGKKLFRIPDPGVKKAPDPGSGSATLVGGQYFGRRKMYLKVYPLSTYITIYLSSCLFAFVTD
jgi:hypothetical protein